MRQPSRLAMNLSRRTLVVVRHGAVVGILALGVAACTPVPSDTCGAASYAAAVGQPTGFVALPTDRPVRILSSGKQMTLDFVPERLNVEVDSLGLVTALRCG